MIELCEDMLSGKIKIEPCKMIKQLIVSIVIIHQYVNLTLV